jgi:hypothetical protein
VSRTDRLFIRNLARSRARLLAREAEDRLLRSRVRPVLPHQRWDYSPPHYLPGELA